MGGSQRRTPLPTRASLPTSSPSMRVSGQQPRGWEIYPISCEAAHTLQGTGPFPCVCGRKGGIPSDPALSLAHRIRFGPANAQLSEAEIQRILMG